MECIKEYLIKKSKLFYELDIDLIIFDSSDTNSTQSLVLEYSKDFTNVKYCRYVGEIEENAIDKKVAYASSRFAKEYDYLIFSSDSTIINLENMLDRLIMYAKAGLDMVIYDNGLPFTTKYTDCIKLLKECAWRMTCLSAIIFSSKFIIENLKIFPINHPQCKGLWLSTACFFQIENKPFQAIYFTEHDLWEVNIARKESFWITSGNVLWQWGKIWFEVIQSLPQKYDAVKLETILSHDKNTEIFSLYGLLRMKMTKNLTYHKVNQYSKFIPYVTETHIIWFYVLSIMPIRYPLLILKSIYKRFKKLKYIFYKRYTKKV